MNVAVVEDHETLLFILDGDDLQVLSIASEKSNQGEVGVVTASWLWHAWL